MGGKKTSTPAFNATMEGTGLVAGEQGKGWSGKKAQKKRKENDKGP